MGKFKEFITEEKDEPYQLLLLVYDTPDDPNKTGDLLEKESKKIKGVNLYQLEIDKGYIIRNSKGNLVAHNFKSDKDLLGNKDIEHDETGWEIIPENTVCIGRGAKGRSIHIFQRMLEQEGVTIHNSIKCHDYCNDKWYTYHTLENAKVRQPKTALITTPDLLDVPLKQMGGKFPMILKTAYGTHGVGVILVSDFSQLLSTTQLLKKMDDDQVLLLQEYIKTDYDVRVMYFNGEIVGQLKRPVIDNDFRSNISQGNEPEEIEITELEKQSCIQAAEAVDGYWVGVDFIPSKNREKEPPYIIEVNGSPGTGYINEKNNMNIYKMILESYKNRDNWT